MPTRYYQQGPTTPGGGAVVLSLLSAICAAGASLTTLLWDGAFPPPPALEGINAALAEARGWSLSTLVLALPLFALGLTAARHGSRSGYLVWLGTLAYLLYTYLELAVSPPFTALYLPYILAFACALCALVQGVTALDPSAVQRALGEQLPRRSIAAFGLATGVLLSLAWLKGIVAQMAAGDFGWPSGIAAVGHVVHALDLGLQAPLGIATAVLLLRRKPGGSVLAGILLTNSVCMGLALTAMVASSALMAGRSPLQAVPFALIPVLAAALATRFFLALERSSDLRAGPGGGRLLPARASARGKS
jgi:hypothetical protein